MSVAAVCHILTFFNGFTDFNDSCHCAQRETELITSVDIVTAADPNDDQLQLN